MTSRSSASTPDSRPSPALDRARHETLRGHIATLHAGRASIEPENLDRRIGLRPESAEPAATIGDLILAHGHHRMEKGDLPYDVIRELFHRLPPSPTSARGSAEPLVDLGCGYGRIAFYGKLLLGDAFRFWGVEILPQRVAEARRVCRALGLGGLSFETGDAARVPWPESDRYCLMNPDLPSNVPPILARLETIARRRPIVIASVSTTNLVLAEQPWLRELGPTPASRVDLRLFGSEP